MSVPPDEEREPDARFSLANERTFLAWGRTCLAMVATGLVVARLLSGDGDRDPLIIASALGLILLGAGLALWSYRNYRRNDEAIRSQKALATSSLPLALLLVIGAASIVAIVLSLKS